MQRRSLPTRDFAEITTGAPLSVCVRAPFLVLSINQFRNASLYECQKKERERVSESAVSLKVCKFGAESHNLTF
jgi:hypothetical protein